MATLIGLLILLATLGAAAALGANLLAGTLAVGAALQVTTLAGAYSAGLSGLLWILWLGGGLLLNVVEMRRNVLSRPLLELFRRILPRMSQTEREALEAGTVWWDAELFSGRPNWHRLLEFPQPRLSEAERAFLDGPVEALCTMLDDWRITRELEDLPPEVWRFMKEKGFFGLVIPKAYGGLEFSALGHSEVVMRIASRSVTAAVTVMVPNSLGPAELLLHYGTAEQKDHYLPRLARGEEIPCFALTGPRAGSDAGAMPDTGVVCKGEFQGKEVLGIRLNWDKRYITLAPVATVLGLAFKLYDPDHLLGETEDLGITCALIPTDTPGVEIGARHHPLDIPFQNGPTRGRDVFIPVDWIIGGAERAGQGWRMLMERLAVGRGISLPALSTGAGKLACRATGAYARIRRQFKLPIGRFEGVEEALARIAGYTYMMDAARSLTATAVDLGEKAAVVSAIVKYNLTEYMRRAVNDAMDVQGGSGICLGPRNLLGRAYQAVPISITVEGANILTRSLIIYGQGAIRCHPYVLEEMHAAADTGPEALERFDAALVGHIGFVLGNLSRMVFLGLSHGHLARAPGGAGRRHYQHLTRLSAAFAFLSDVAMLVLGGSLKRREKITGRFADALSHLYLASAVLKRFEEQGHPAADRPLMHWACRHALHQIQEALDGLLRNFPYRLGWLLRPLVFPLGRRFPPPADRLGHLAAQVLLAPGEARDRLTAGIHLPADPGEPLGRLEEALPAVIAAEAVERKLRELARQGTIGGETPLDQARAALDQKLIEAEAFEAVARAEALRDEVIQVDSFPPRRAP